MVAQLAEDAGGKRNIKRDFVSTKDRAISYQRALTNYEMGIAGSQTPTPLTRDRQAKALLIPRSIAEKAGFFPRPENQPPATTPNLDPIATPHPKTTAAVTIQSNLGTWETDEPAPWLDSDLHDARSTIQNDPTAAENFKCLIPRSQWKQVGIKEVESCAA